jgi:hypothetical protein
VPEVAALRRIAQGDAETDAEGRADSNTRTKPVLLFVGTSTLSPSATLHARTTDENWIVGEGRPSNHKGAGREKMGRVIDYSPLGISIAAGGCLLLSQTAARTATSR